MLCETGRLNLISSVFGIIVVFITKWKTPSENRIVVCWNMIHSQIGWKMLKTIASKTRVWNFHPSMLLIHGRKVLTGDLSMLFDSEQHLVTHWGICQKRVAKNVNCFPHTFVTSWGGHHYQLNHWNEAIKTPNNHSSATPMLLPNSNKVAFHTVFSHRVKYPESFDMIEILEK